MVDCLNIAFDNPQGWFYPGGIISGTVIVQTHESIKARAIKVRFDGEAKTQWTESRIYSNRTERERYCAQVNYGKFEQILWRPPPGQNRLLTGQHLCRFQFQVPLNAAPSFEARDGHIRYSIEAHIDRPWRVDNERWVGITILPYIDLNVLPYAGYPLLREYHKIMTCCCYTYGRMVARLFVCKSGFVPGEVIPLKVEVQNFSRRPVSYFEASVYQVQHFTGNHCSYGRVIHKRSLVSRIRRAFIPKRLGNFSHEDSLQIGPCVPSFNCCPIIQVDYVLTVQIEADVINGLLTCEVPILIGSVPVARPIEVPIDEIRTGDQLVPPEPSAPPKDFVPQVSDAPPTGAPDGEAPRYQPKCYFYTDLKAPTKEEKGPEKGEEKEQDD